MSSFEPLTTQSLADSVELQLISYIQKEKLNYGDNLPSEKDMASQLCVSRSIIREGISRLKRLGILESRRKKGLTYCRPDIFSSIRTLADVQLLSSSTKEELMQMRVALELGMADFIYANKTPEALEKLESIALNENKDNKESRVEHEVEFHTYLFEISGNKASASFHSILISAFEMQERSSEANPYKNATHLDICNTLKNGTCEEFRQIMRNHVQQYLPKNL